MTAAVLHFPEQPALSVETLRVAARTARTKAMRVAPLRLRVGPHDQLEAMTLVSLQMAPHGDSLRSNPLYMVARIVVEAERNFWRLESDVCDHCSVDTDASRATCRNCGAPTIGAGQP